MNTIVVFWYLLYICQLLEPVRGIWAIDCSFVFKQGINHYWNINVKYCKTGLDALGHQSSSSKRNSTASRASCTCLCPRGMLATLANMLYACWSSSCWHLCVQCVSCLETVQACYWRNAIENFDWESKSCCLSLSVDLCPELSAMELFVESLRKLPQKALCFGGCPRWKAIFWHKAKHINCIQTTRACVCAPSCVK